MEPKNKKVHTVKGIVVDKNTEIITEDYEEWDCMAGVSITINGADVNKTNIRGKFEIPNIQNTNHKLKFKRKYKDYDTNITIPDDADEFIVPLVKMELD